MDITLSEQIEKLTADLGAAQGLVNESNEKFQALSADNETLKTSINTLNEEKTKLEASLTERDAQIKDLSEIVGKLQSEAKSAEDRAVEIMASMGVPAVAANNSETVASKSRAELYAEFKSIQDPVKRAEFWINNKPAILKGE